MLAAVAPRDARAAALPARRADQAARCARSPPRPGCRSPPRPSRRTSASSPAPARRRSWPATRGLDDRPGEIVDRDGARARPPPRRAPLHRRPAQGARRRRRPSRCYVLATDMRREPRRRRPARGARHARRSRCAARACTAPAAEVDRVKLRYRSPPCRAAWRPSTAAAAIDARAAASPSTAPRPGQTACLLRGDVVVGWGTIAQLDSCHGDDHRRDPRAVPLLLRGARPQAPAVGPADPAARATPRRC